MATDPYYQEYEDTFYGVSYPAAFEGAVHNYKTEQRSLLAGEADTLAVREVLLLQQRVAHAIRNNGYAKAAADKFVTNLGNITVSWKDAKGNKVSKMEDYWQEFISDPCLDGHGDLGTFMATQNHEFFATGVSFYRQHIRRTETKVPLKLEGIPTALHALWHGGAMKKDTMYGIKFADTRPISYFFAPSEIELLLAGNFPDYTPTEIPASEIAHRFIRTSPGQWIGLPFLASVLIPLYELDELVDATIAKQKAAQAIAWIIENTSPISMTPTGTAVNYQTKEGDGTPKNKVFFKSQGGNTQYLNKGEKLQQVQSGDIGQNLPVLIRSELYRICATVGIPYHSLTGDTSGLNFSSIRAIAIELRNRLEYIHHHYTIPLTYRPLTTKFYNLARLYDKKIPVCQAKYQLPIWRGIDDLKDDQADVLEVQSGMATLASKLDERHVTFEEIMSDRERIKELGLDNLLYPNGQAMAQTNNTSANTNSSSN